MNRCDWAWLCVVAVWWIACWSLLSRENPDAAPVDQSTYAR